MKRYPSFLISFFIAILLLLASHNSLAYAEASANDAAAEQQHNLDWNELDILALDASKYFAKGEQAIYMHGYEVYSSKTLQQRRTVALAALGVSQTKVYDWNNGLRVDTIAFPTCPPPVPNVTDIVLPTRVVSAGALGEPAALVVSLGADGRLYSHLSSVPIYQNPEASKFTALSCSKSWCLALTQRGAVFNVSSAAVVTPLSAVSESLDSPVVQIVAAWDHSLLLTQNGTVYCLGEACSSSSCATAACPVAGLDIDASNVDQVILGAQTDLSLVFFRNKNEYFWWNQKNPAPQKKALKALDENGYVVDIQTGIKSFSDGALVTSDGKTVLLMGWWSFYGISRDAFAMPLNLVKLPKSMLDDVKFTSTLQTAVRTISREGDQVLLIADDGTSYVLGLAEDGFIEQQFDLITRQGLAIGPAFGFFAPLFFLFFLVWIWPAVRKLRKLRTGEEKAKLQIPKDCVHSFLLNSLLFGCHVLYLAEHLLRNVFASDVLFNKGYLFKCYFDLSRSPLVLLLWVVPFLLTFIWAIPMTIISFVKYGRRHVLTHIIGWIFFFGSLLADVIVSGGVLVLSAAISLNQVLNYETPPMNRFWRQTTGFFMDAGPLVSSILSAWLFIIGSSLINRATMKARSKYLQDLRDGKFKQLLEDGAAGAPVRKEDFELNDEEDL